MWLNKNPTKNGYTWCDAENSPKSRIDYIFVRNDSIDYVKNIVVRKLPGTHNKNTRLSDHRLIKCNLNFSNLERGKGYWKLNISHLENEDYKRGILELFKNINDLLDPISKWETFKIKVRDYSINYARQSKNNVKHRLKLIEERIDDIENLPSGDIDMNEKRKLEKELDFMYNEIAKGAQIRSKAKWINGGERNTKFF